MDRKIYEEIEKSRFLSQYNRGKTLTENRMLLVEGWGLAKNIVDWLVTRGLKTGLDAALTLNLKNIEKVFGGEFVEKFAKNVEEAILNKGLPQLDTALKLDPAGKAYKISNRLLILQKVVRDGGTAKLSKLEANLFHDALASTNTTFNKALLEALEETSEMTMLKSKTLSNSNKLKMLDDVNGPLYGFSDDLFKKAGVAVDVIRGTAPSVIKQSAKNLLKGVVVGTKEWSKKFGVFVGKVLKNMKTRFQNLKKNYKLKVNWKNMKLLPVDTFVALTMWPIWKSFTIWKYLILRVGKAGLFSKFSKKAKMFGKQGTLKKEFAGADAGSLMNRGLFSDLVELTTKEGASKGGKMTINLLNWISRATSLTGTRQLNYIITAAIWISWHVYAILPSWGKGPIDFVRQLFSGTREAQLGGCGIALTGIYADVFDKQALNKMGIDYDISRLKGDAIELYAALSPQCFTSEEDWKLADEAVITFIEEAPNKLYISLVAKEYAKLTKLKIWKILPDWEGLCGKPMFVPSTLYEDINNFKKLTSNNIIEWGKDFLDISQWAHKVKRLDYPEYCDAFRDTPLIGITFDQMVLDVSDYLYDPDSKAYPEWLDELPEEVLDTIKQEMFADTLKEIDAKLKEISDKADLMGWSFDKTSGDFTIDLKDLTQLSVKLMSAPGMDQLVYLNDVSGEFVDWGEIYDEEEHDEVGEVMPMTMKLIIYPNIGNSMEYALGDTARTGGTLKKDDLCSSQNTQVGYMCYYKQFQDGENYYDYLPDISFKDGNNITKTLKSRVNQNKQKDVGELNPILYALAAYNRFNLVATGKLAGEDGRKRRYIFDDMSYEPFEIQAEIIKNPESKKRIKENIIGLGSLLNR